MTMHRSMGWRPDLPNVRDRKDLVVEMEPALAQIAPLLPKGLAECPAQEQIAAIKPLRDCIECLACVSVCPAYQLTGEELVTGRAKLRMAESLAARELVAPREALRHFQCLRCGLCEEVCQTRLPLRDCYLVLEGWVARQHGHPAELIRDFLGRVDESQEWTSRAFGLDQPEWSPAPRAASREGAA